MPKPLSGNLQRLAGLVIGGRKAIYISSKLKPLANVRFNATQEKDIEEWFNGYWKALIDVKIKRKKRYHQF